MKLLLDENLPQALRHELAPHEVSTAVFMGWSMLVNGRLLASAAAAGFHALITCDRGIEYEQNQATLPVAVIILRVRGTNIEAIRPVLPRLLAAIDELPHRSLIKLYPPDARDA